MRQEACIRTRQQARYATYLFYHSCVTCMSAASLYHFNSCCLLEKTRCHNNFCHSEVLELTCIRSSIKSAGGRISCCVTNLHTDLLHSDFTNYSVFACRGEKMIHARSGGGYKKVSNSEAHNIWRRETGFAEFNVCPT